MRDKVELKVRELQNKAEQNKEELTTIKLDTVIEGQENAESNAIKRSVDAEENAIARDAVQDQKSMEREETREDSWKRRFYISWGVGLTCYVLTIAYMTFTKTELVKSYEQQITGLEEQFLKETRVKHALRKQVDSLNKTIHKGILAYSEANKNTEALKEHVENYAKFTISSLSEQTNAQTRVIKELANQIGILTEDEASFAEVINSLPAEQKSAWDHFAAQLEKDEEATVKHMELEHKKQMKNHHGKDDSLSLK